ncbi:hypothetical protein Pmani_036297 [Petrolisthes manimaculis]|uniref:Peptidase S1 domain-containing protein n=1 Tax=Petrolisthes manimaculis TaxID=1843537 RepID=A0AAE1TMK0_9EUCA|nr:hypothetical protein Pmani_036297 [Petrolisthes manimaculis]
MKTFVLCLLVAGAFAAPSAKPRFRRGLNKIVGGTDAAPGELPYQLSFQDTSFGSGFHFCGASIYNENWAICAGHCVQGEDFNNPDYLKVVAGELDMDVVEAAPSAKPRFRRGLNKIVGGTDAAPGELPYQLSFQDTSFGSGFHFCGASIYNENWAICAGHCVQGEDFNNPDYLKVVAGELDMDVVEAAPSAKPRFRRGLNKIVGGTDAAPGELPYQLSFQDTSFGSGFHFCGASIYNENWAICAGHCVQGEDFNNPDYLKVVAGELDMDVVEVQFIFVHKGTAAPPTPGSSEPPASLNSK